jgi:hypothetical protein
MPNKTYIKVGGDWKNVTAIWRKTDGTWGPNVISWIKASGVWRFCIAGTGIAHPDVRIGTTEEGVCALDFVTVYSNTETLSQGDTVYFTSFLTTPVTGYTWITLGFEVYRLNATTGVIGTKTTTTCI